MTLQTVLLYANETMLENGISSLIAADGELQLTVVPAGDIQDLWLSSAAILPEVIIFEHSLLETYSGLLNRLWDKLENARVITFERDQNLLHVYTRQGIQIQNGSDLLRLIRSQIQTRPPATKSCFDPGDI